MSKLQDSVFSSLEFFSIKKDSYKVLLDVPYDENELKIYECTLYEIKFSIKRIIAQRTKKLIWRLPLLLVFIASLFIFPSFQGLFAVIVCTLAQYFINKTLIVDDIKISLLRNIRKYEKNKKELRKTEMGADSVYCLLNKHLKSADKALEYEEKNNNSMVQLFLLMIIAFSPNLIAISVAFLVLCIVDYNDDKTKSFEIKRIEELTKDLLVPLD